MNEDAKNNLTNYYHDPKMESIVLEKAEFNLEQVRLQFDLSNRLQRLLVESNKMYILTSTHVYRIHLENPSEVTAVQLPSLADLNKLSNAWLHPSGEFLIIQMNFMYHYHLHITYKRFKSLLRFKGFKVSNIAFCQQKNDQSTGDFLLSTKDGQVLVANVKYHDPDTQDSKRDDKYVKQIYSTKKNITGLSLSNNGTRVIVATDSELLLWDCFEASLAELSRSLHHPPLIEELPGLGLTFTTNENHYYFFHKASGLCLSDDTEIKSNAGHFLTFANKGILPGYQSFMTSKYYIFQLSTDAEELIVLSKLTSQSVKSIQLSSIANNEKVIGITSDSMDHTHWVFTRNRIFELVITDEVASAWYSYYKMGDFEHALELVEGSEESGHQKLKRNVILQRQGYELLQKGGFGIPLIHTDVEGDTQRLRYQFDGILKLALLNEPFEKVCLMLMSVDKLDGQSNDSNKLMITYLKSKLESTEGIEKNRVKELVLSSWIVRLYLGLMRNLKISMLKHRNDEGEAKHLQSEYSKMSDTLSSFLRTNTHVLDRKTIYKTMDDLGFTDELLSFANMLEDFQFSMQFHIQNESWMEALRSLTLAYTLKSRDFTDLIYKTSTILLINAPRATTECWLKFSGIEYEKLIPAILAHKRNEKAGYPGDSATMKFLLVLIFEKEIKSKALAECYLSLLIMSRSSGELAQPSNKIIQALDFLRKARTNEENNFAFYDPTFILRTCLRFERIEPAISILVKDLQLHKEGLFTALQNNLIPQAEMVLRNYEENIYQSPSNDMGAEFSEVQDGELNDPSSSKLEDCQNSVRRKLWVSYAKYVIDECCRDQLFNLDGLSDKSTFKELPKRSSSKDDTGSIEKPTLSSRLSDVLQYLLQLSFSAKDNASVLTIKDLLPLLPASITISNFKAEIVDSLNVFNNKINQLGLEMQESSVTATKLKLQIEQSKSLEKRGHIYTIVEPGESCNICGKLLILKKFILFPNCHHGFHKDCMIRFLLQLKGDYTFKKSFRNFKQFSSVVDKNELDELLLKECLLCNESNLNTIDDNLIEADRTDTQDWVL